MHFVTLWSLFALALSLRAGTLHGIERGISEQTRQIAGFVVDEEGRALPGIDVLAEPIGAVPNPRRDTSRADGAFSVDLDPGVYAVTADAPPPRGLARTRVDVRSASATAVTLRVPDGPSPFVPDDPPKANLIQLSSPDENNMVSVTGAAGAVPGESYVIAIALRTGLFSTTQARADGSFETRLRAPYGTWVMIKHDPIGTTYSRILFEAQYGGEGSPAPLPGTYLRVVDPPGESGLVFADEGLVSGHLWRVEGTIDKARLQHGDRLTIKGRLIVDSSICGDGIENVSFFAHSRFERLSGQGVSASRSESIFASNMMTPTGFPIEKGGANSGGASSVTFEATRVSSTRCEGPFEMSVPIVEAMPSGHYRAAIRFDPTTAITPAERPPHIEVDKATRQPQDFAWLPLVTIGDPPAPRLPVMLLLDVVGNATQGIRAIEDDNAFGLASRVALQSDRLVIPRTDGATDAPIRYRLEPYLPSLSIGDRGVPPDPPQIPFRLPSGRLTVRIEKPSGVVDTLGPAAFVQARTKSIVDRHGVALIHGGSGGMVTEPYQLSTMDPRFEIAFNEEGLHRLRVEMTVDDERGVTWSGGGTYEVHVARQLWIDTSTLPGTSFATGDSVPVAGVLVPPMAADIVARIRFARQSDPARMIDRTIRTRSNRFGAFLAPESFVFAEAGEYRVDIEATAWESAGRAWAGTRTWGGVVADPASPIVAHGQRGIDDLPDPRPQWFFRNQTTSPLGPTHVFLPFHGGDVAWMQRSDAAKPTLTFQDLDGSVVSRMKPSIHVGADFDARAAIGETPLLIGRGDGIDGHVEPARNDLWGYSYRSIQRPLVRVREEISDDACNGCYWRFGELYAAQAGVGRNGDLPNDFKFQFGGVVLRGPAIGVPVYAIYGSLFVLVADDDPRGGTRIMPPFQGNGGGPDGGPLFTLKGKEIDLFFHPTAVRPGTILHRGERVSFAGYSAPTLPSKIEIVLTSPSGLTRTIRGQANEIGYFYDPEQRFAAGETGVWKAKARIVFDGRTSAGQVLEPFPNGGVLGSRGGEFNFYVVDANAAQLELASMPQFVRPADGAVTFTVLPPAGLTNIELTHTTTMPGFILDETTSTSMAYRYDAIELAKDFPNLDLHDENGFAGADAITISFLLSGTDASGAKKHFARQVVLQGEELHIPSQHARPKRRAVRSDD